MGDYELCDTHKCFLGHMITGGETWVTPESKKDTMIWKKTIFTVSAKVQDATFNSENDGHRIRLINFDSKLGAMASLTLLLGQPS